MRHDLSFQEMTLDKKKTEEEEGGRNFVRRY